MGCSHTTHCPLFPYLNASLSGWRETYCDSRTGWTECARFQLSLAGEPVPLALLPNGRLPVSLIPNLPRTEATAPPTRPTPPTPPALSAPPLPAPPAPATPTRPRDSLWRRLMPTTGPTAWTRLRDWLRAPA